VAKVSNFIVQTEVTFKIILFDQNLIIINYKVNSNFRSHIIFEVIQE
jgi:hypothetical protein